MTIKILRILGIRSKSPVVLATVDGFAVRWQPREGWSCECDEVTFPDCPHIPAMKGLLDPRVLTSPPRSGVVCDAPQGLCRLWRAHRGRTMHRLPTARHQAERDEPRLRLGLGRTVPASPSPTAVLYRLRHDRGPDDRPLAPKHGDARKPDCRSVSRTSTSSAAAATRDEERRDLGGSTRLALLPDPRGRQSPRLYWVAILAQSFASSSAVPLVGSQDHHPVGLR